MAKRKVQIRKGVEKDRLRLKNVIKKKFHLMILLNKAIPLIEQV